MKPMAIAAVALLLMAGPVAEIAADDSEDIIKYRQKAMASQGGHVSAMSQIVRGKVSYTEHMKAHAVGVAGVAGHIKSMFPEGSDFGVTDAKMEIWERWADFEKAADEAKEAADALVVAVDSGDKAAIGDAFKTLGESCKGCHEDFKEDDD
ncbi:MAG: cytochrome c [Gammaproteobacteria bacterium]|nr:cytochrome c [Gammaproteobacteria bacterium]